jgi:transcription initiation factor TFIIE subunit alpha
MNGKILSDKFIQEFLVENFGENAVKVLKVMNGEMSDEEIAAKSKIKITEVRAILNKLSFMRLVEYSKTRDDNTGWYSYYWRPALSRIKEVMEKITEEKIRKLEEQLDDTKVYSFYCPKCSSENKLDFDLASAVNFKCPNCNNDLKPEKRDAMTIIETLEELKKKYNEIKNLKIEEKIAKVEEKADAKELKEKDGKKFDEKKKTGMEKTKNKKK